ncbi:DNA polymerase III subunit delta' [Marinospirillum alkaliphilum]|uniref:DNA polymerase III subunit delta' n=1 Tax=Marinospirillum alkaliphilum DSM 21637 TaxID=1122209 RepID=A0A1K1UIC5_9GAMM|nr:DNA polymerase III subunit delta' [Marinospirillum alkaliphilum]SFX12187.1 DNA polymerase-3 subunit delta' [Marinospirillum alkaliphilum DSM 21637]
MKPAQALPWHAEIWQQWMQQLHEGRLPHALLITGLPGLGKRTLARALAHQVLCRQPDGGHPCGHCQDCQLLASGFHPDLHQLEPESEGKAIKVDQVREVSSQVQKTAQQGGYKLVLLWPAEALNINAANALLKTLEEPEPRTLFLLVSDRPSGLPATLRSRCQQWAVKAPTLVEGQAWLRAQLSEDQSPQILLKAASGRPLQALKLAEGEAEHQRQAIQQVIESLVRGADPVDLAARLKSIPLRDLLNCLQAWLADSLRLRLLGDAAVQDSRQLPLYQQLNALLGVRQLLNLEQGLRQLHLQLQSNPNTELFLENLLISLTQEMGHE